MNLKLDTNLMKMISATNSSDHVPSDKGFSLNSKPPLSAQLKNTTSGKSKEKALSFLPHNFKIKKITSPMSVSSLSDIFASRKLEKAIRKNLKGINKRPPLSPLPPKANASHMKHEKNDKISKFQYVFDKDQETLQNISNSRNKRGPHRTVKLVPISKSELKARAISRCSAGILPSIQKKQNRSLSNASANTIPILSNFQDLFHINNCPFEIKRENRGIRNKSEILREKPSSALPIPSSPLPIPSSPLQTPSKYKENLVNQFSTIKKLKKNFFNFSESSTVTPESTPPTFSKGSMMFFKKLRVVPSKKTQDPF